MNAATVKFLDCLERSHLLAAGMVGRIRQRMLESPVAIDPRRAAKGLVDRKLITAWQARQLLAGHHAFFLGRYKLLDRLGKGGMGVVFKAKHPMMDRTVALKVMSRELLDNPRAVARFQREVKTAAALHHPNIITAFDADAVGSTHFLVMEYAEGQDLNQWLKGHGTMPIPVACECAMQTAEGLGHAFRQGMVHRDIKPINLMVTWSKELNRPVIKILDMGLARFVSEAVEDGGVTKAGQTIGTPDYIAPEAAANFKNADIRADIFSLGCALFKLLAGRLPFVGANTMEKLLARSQSPPASLRQFRPDVPPELEAVVNRMLARDPDDRYQTPAEVAAALAPFAASTSGQAVALDIFRELELPAARVDQNVESDADSSLATMEHDIGVSPLRDDAGVVAEPLTEARNDAALVADDDEDDSVEVLPLGGAAPVMPPPLPSKKKSAAAAATLDTSAAAAPVGQWASASAVPAATTERRNVWDSPLLLIGGGALLAMVLAGGGLYWALTRQTGDQSFKLAEEDYKRGAYAQAMQRYNLFLLNYPKHPSISLARVHQGMAQLRQAVDAGGDYTRHLKLADDTLASIATEKDFGDARGELAALLPKIAEGLSAQAREKRQPELIESARQALALVEKYVPKNLRPTDRLEAVEKSLSLASRDIERGTALAKAIADMQGAVASGKPSEAYAFRETLLKRYPDLESDEQLQKIMVDVTTAEQAAVVVLNERVPAGAATPSESPGAITFYSRSGAAVPQAPSEVCTTVAMGSVFALDAGSGELLWRRSIGFAADVQPQPTADGSDLILIDSKNWQAERVAARTGEVRWQQAVGSPTVGEPVVLTDRVLISTVAGQVTQIDLATGELLRATQLPQPLATSVATSNGADPWYAVGSHSNLYVLAADASCQKVFYLGHAPNTVRVPPLVVPGSADNQPFFYVAVAENRTLQDSVLHILLSDAEGIELKPVQQIPLEGHVVTPPLLDNRLVTIVTDRGAIMSLEVGTPQSQPAWKTVLNRPATTEEHYTPLTTIVGGKLLVADRGLTRYDLQAATGQVDVLGVHFRGELFRPPLEAAGPALLTAREALAGGGLHVAAVRPDVGTPYWESNLATQPAAPVAVGAGGRELWLVDTSGGLQVVGADTIESAAAVRPSPAHVDLPAAAEAWLLPIGETRAVLASAGRPELLVLDRRENGFASRAISLPGPPACGPRTFAKGVLVACASGQVVLLDPQNGKSMVEPFQPTLAAGERVAWTGIAKLSDENFVTSDGRDRVYRIGIAAQPKRNLATTADIKLRVPLASPLLRLGDHVFAVDQAHKLHCLAGADLKSDAEQSLSAACVWGPVAAGTSLLLATDDNQLWCFDAACKPRWKVPLAPGRPVGNPLVEGDDLILTMGTGTVLRLSGADGSTKAQADTKLPLAGSLVRFANRFVAPASDGTLRSIELPK